MSTRSSHSRREEEEEDEDIQLGKRWTRPSKISEIKRRPGKHEREIHQEINNLGMIPSAMLLCRSYPTKEIGLKTMASYIMDDTVQQRPGERLEKCREKVRRELEQKEPNRGTQNGAKEGQKGMTLDDLVDNLNLG
jgi:hypothetical protein